MVSLGFNQSRDYLILEKRKEIKKELPAKCGDPDPFARKNEDDTLLTFYYSPFYLISSNLTLFETNCQISIKIRIHSEYLTISNRIAQKLHFVLPYILSKLSLCFH